MQENKTALYWAVEKGNATMVRDILQCNPDTETCTKVRHSRHGDTADTGTHVMLIDSTLGWRKPSDQSNKDEERGDRGDAA